MAAAFCVPPLKVARAKYPSHGFVIDRRDFFYRCVIKEECVKAVFAQRKQVKK
jgi:hypothetical protein